MELRQYIEEIVKSAGLDVDKYKEMVDDLMNLFDEGIGDIEHLESEVERLQECVDELEYELANKEEGE